MVVGFAGMACGQIARPEVPAAIQAPAGEVVVLQAHATGSQIYVCHAGADGKFGWALKGPDAELHDPKGAVIGTHFAGPTWKHNDGSEVLGKLVAKVDAPEAGSIPWLLVGASGHTGSGVFSGVTSIQRIHTRGGVVPAATCAAAQDGVEAKSGYEADYYFFAAGK